MCTPTILYIAPKLVGPVQLTISKAIVITLYYLVDYLNCKIVIATSTVTPIVVAESPNLIIDLLFMAAVYIYGVFQS